MSKPKEGAYTAEVGGTLQKLHALFDIIGPHIGARIEEYAKS